MEQDSDFDAYVARELDVPPLSDDGFTLAVVARLRQYRRRRQLLLGGAAALATASAMLAAPLLSAPSFSLPSLSPGTIVAILLLAASCIVVWITTEPSRALQLR